jgi:hypothetical protein
MQSRCGRCLAATIGVIQMSPKQRQNLSGPDHKSTRAVEDASAPSELGPGFLPWSTSLLLEQAGVWPERWFSSRLFLKDLESGAVVLAGGWAVRSVPALDGGVIAVRRFQAAWAAIW